MELLRALLPLLMYLAAESLVGTVRGWNVDAFIGRLNGRPCWKCRLLTKHDTVGMFLIVGNLLHSTSPV